MNPPRAISIQQKLRYMLVGTAGTALLLAGGLILWFGLRDFEKNLRHELTLLAEQVAFSAEAPLDFSTEDELVNVIRRLRSNPDILAGGLYSTNHTLVATFKRADNSPQPPPTSPVVLARPQAGPAYDGGTFEIYTPVRLTSGEEVGRLVGAVYLRVDPAVRKRFILRSASSLGASLVVALVVAWMLAARFQSYITSPILDLVGTMKNISADKNYAARARPAGRDELGQLVEGFNEMLGQIEQRDAELRRHREHLEEQVAERTRELTRVNQDLVLAKEKAEVASQTKSNFLANMSHELRTPLNAILGYTEMLQEEAEDPGQQDFAPDLERIHVSARHLLALINDVLDLSKIEAGKMTLYLETFNVATLVEDASTSIRPVIERNGNRLEVTVDPNCGLIRADLIKVRQTLFNLLSNAAKFTEKGVIRLVASRRREGGQEWISIQVSDTGIGMTSEQMSRLFQAFAQADTSTTRKYGGTGLGLVISRRFCQLMGGDLAVSSEVGKGTTFTAHIPSEVRDPAELPRTAAPAATLNTLTSGLGTILVIDDDPIARDLVTRALSREGIRVESAANGPQGIALARQSHPALILLDVMMPGMDGWTVLAELKNDPDTADIPVILVTILEDRHMGFALGAADYVTKPVDWTRLSGVIQKYLRAGTADEILVVEDHADTREMLRRKLEAAGWKVVVAENGRVALERLAIRKPALVLLDLIMPEMDGFQFMDALRRRQDGPHPPVIVLTAKDLTENERAQLSGDVVRIMQKGAYAVDELRVEIERLMARRGISLAPSPDAGKASTPVPAEKT